MFQHIHRYYKRPVIRYLDRKQEGLLKTKKNYQETLKRIERIWDALPGTPESDELDILATLVEKYEEANYAIAAPDPVEAIKFRMEQIGMDKKDLAKIIGANRVSELFSKKDCYR